MERIPFSGPSNTQKEIDYVADAAANAWYGQANMYHERFETAFAAYVGTRYASALPSCTAAIHLALIGVGVEPDSEVIAPALTFVGSINPIRYCGAHSTSWMPQRKSSATPPSLPIRSSKAIFGS